MGGFCFADGEYGVLGAAYSELFSNLSEMHTQYSSTLHTLVASGISQGRVADNLRVFHQTVRIVGGDVNNVAPIATPATDEAIVAISNADHRG